MIAVLLVCLGCKHNNPSSVDLVKETLLNKGTKINFIGVSYVANHKEPIKNSWEYKLCQKYGCIYRNYGINGDPLISESKGIPPVINRYIEMDKDNIYG